MGRITWASRSFSASTMAAAMLEPDADTFAAFWARLFPFCSYGAGIAPEARRDPWKRWTGTIRSSLTWGSRSSPRFAWAFSRLILSAWRYNRGYDENCKQKCLIFKSYIEFCGNWPEPMQKNRVLNCLVTEQLEKFQDTYMQMCIQANPSNRGTQQ